MSRYLQIKVEDIYVLLPALQVHEVTQSDALVIQADAHVVWRDQVIALVDLGQKLDRPHCARRGYGVVYSLSDDGQAPVMLQVDEVLGLRSPLASDMRALPRLRAETAAWLEGLWLEPPLGERHSYFLRHPVRVALTEPANTDN